MKCILQKHVNPVHLKEKGDVPIFIPDKKDAFVIWPEIQEPENLFIWVELGLRKGVEVGSDIAIVRVRYFRAGFNDIADLRYQCSEPFLYGESINKNLAALTTALSTCLTVPYVHQP